jgi:hypothetical protein
MYPKSPGASADISSRAVALLDARFVRWLAHLDDAEAAAPGLTRAHLASVVSRALDQAHLRRSLHRIYWYTESDDRTVVDDQTVRLLPAEEGDGVHLVRQMSADIAALLAGGRIDLLVIGSDDDRLTSVIDAAKLAGVTVCLLADERALAMPRLLQQDPNWARLLREADRRLVVRSSELAQALSPDGPLAPAASSEPGANPLPRRPFDLDVQLQPVVETWWADLPSDAREALQEELPALRGLPPEVDRELLLRGKNALGRALNFHEKRSLRAQARNVALGMTAAGAASTDEAAGKSQEPQIVGEA